jgi:hypothetical protein
VSFGHSVAVSGDTALVGASSEVFSHNAARGGAVWVFVRRSSGWRLQAVLTPPGGLAGNSFGGEVALDGNTALISDNAAVHVFVRSGTTWTQQARLTSDADDFFDSFGCSLAVEGDTALVGGWGIGVGSPPTQVGAAFVFVRTGTTWSKQQMLTGPGIPWIKGTELGWSVALSGDRALVGAPDASAPNGVKSGMAYVFLRNGTAWSQEAALYPEDAVESAGFGSSVALRAETALVGASGATVAGQAVPGAAYVFARNGGAWTQSKLVSGEATAGEGFGGAVALSDEQTALVGAGQADVGGRQNVGAVYAFARSGADWARLAKMSAPNGAAGDGFGLTIATAASTALIGAPFQDIGGRHDVGAAYPFARSGSSWARQTRLIGQSRIDKLTPSSGKRGSALTITGLGFSQHRGTNYVQFGAQRCGWVVSWSGTRIKIKVPSNVPSGPLKVRVVTATGKSNAKTFVVR